MSRAHTKPHVWETNYMMPFTNDDERIDAKKNQLRKFAISSLYNANCDFIQFWQLIAIEIDLKWHVLNNNLTNQLKIIGRKNYENYCLLHTEIHCNCLKIKQQNLNYELQWNPIWINAYSLFSHDPSKKPTPLDWETVQVTTKNDDDDDARMRLKRHEHTSFHRFICMHVFQCGSNNHDVRLLCKKSVWLLRQAFLPTKTGEQSAKNEEREKNFWPHKSKWLSEKNYAHAVSTRIKFLRCYIVEQLASCFMEKKMIINWNSRSCS